jgi:tetratricopeptide (TPR) repeat protein
VKAPVKAPVAARAAAPAFAVPATLEDAMKRARASENTPDKGIPAWKDIIAKNPTERAPRRELARVLRSHDSWAQLADALEDEVQKTVHSSPEKAEMFLELAETYGKLNNDNQVMAALTAALQQDPQRLEIYDRLGSLYETKKRWPDLIKVLTEKAERTEGASNKVAIFLQIAKLYLERFSHQAEAIKAFERVLDLDPHNQEAINHLLVVYEKRRDREKLNKLKEAEVERTHPTERAANKTPADAVQRLGLVSSAETSDARWCTECEHAYDTWSRRHATDIIWSLMAAMVIVTSTAIVLPLLGVDWIIAAVGVFTGFGTLLGLHRANRRRRRRQFLRGAAIPRAYLTDGRS